MIRTYVLPCALPGPVAQALNRESGRIYAQVLVTHWRVVSCHQERCSMGGVRWSQAQLDYLRAHYSNPTMPLAVIAAHVGRHAHTVCTMANKLGLYRIGPGYIKHFPDPFAAYTPPQMWTLGLWYTDGHVTRKHAYMTQKDRGLLEQVRSIVASPSIQERVKIFPYYGKSLAWVLQISSVDMVRYLAMRGVFSRKSCTMKFPEWMPWSVMPHFVRGLWDGDGYIGSNKRGTLVMSYACGSLAFIESLVGILEVITEKRPMIHEQKLQACYTIGLHGNTATLFGDWLYENSTDAMRLRRKYDRYMSHKSYPAAIAGYA